MAKIRYFSRRKIRPKAVLGRGVRLGRHFSSSLQNNISEPRPNTFVPANLPIVGLDMSRKSYVVLLGISFQPTAESVLF